MYRIASARATWWDYGDNGLYFVTICTHGKVHYFGKVVDGNMRLSKMGDIAYKYWLEIPEHFPFVKLDAFVVMPNHVHGVLIIDKPDVECRDVACNVFEPGGYCADSMGDVACNVSTFKGLAMSDISPKVGSLAAVIRSYKSAVTKVVRKVHADFAWQTRFHDHVILNEKGYNKVVNYVVNNPSLWEEDKFYTE